MGNQKEIRGRIASTISTQQITKAMKLVSATKLKRASDAITRMRPYALKLKGILGNLQDSVDNPNLAVYFEEREVKNVLVIAVSSDRGLCGGFNANVIKRCRKMTEVDYAGKNITFLCLGKKAAEGLRRFKLNVDDSHITAFHHFSSDNAFAICDEVLAAFKDKKYDRVELVYNQFKNAATQILVAEQLLPMVPEAKTSGQSANNDYIFEPDKISILEDLVPRSLKTQLFRAMLESLASEHGARMVAMDKATENAGDLLKSLRLAYNQARQAAITNEISEIVGGAAALEG